MPTTSGNTDKTSTERNEGIDEVPKYPRWGLELSRYTAPGQGMGHTVVSLETADPNVLAAALRAAADTLDPADPDEAVTWADRQADERAAHDAGLVAPWREAMRVLTDALGGRGPLHRGQPPEAPEPAGPRPDVLGDFLDRGFVGMNDLDALRDRVLDLRADRDRWQRIAGREREVADALRAAERQRVGRARMEGPARPPEPSQEPRTAAGVTRPSTDAPDGSQGPSGRPAAEGGVWGSYIDYLERLEAEVAARAAVADRKVSAVWLQRCWEIRDALLDAGVYPIGGTPGVVGAVQDVLREHARLLARLRDLPQPGEWRSEYAIKMNSGWIIPSPGPADHRKAAEDAAARSSNATVVTRDVTDWRPLPAQRADSRPGSPTQSAERAAGVESDAGTAE